MTMKIKNLNKGILYLLRNKRSAWESKDPLETEAIYDKYSDIPNDNIEESLNALAQDGFIELSSDEHLASITRKGLDRLIATTPQIFIKEAKLFKKILYPVDLSETSAKVQPYVEKMSEKFNAEVHMLYVANVTHNYSYVGLPQTSIGDFEGAIVKGVEGRLKKISESFKRMPEKYTILTGHPGSEIVNYVTEENIDLIIMGHSSTGIERAIFGSVAGFTVKYSPVPVLIISPKILDSDES